MVVLLCPGFHAAELTESFVAVIGAFAGDVLVAPDADRWAASPLPGLQRLKEYWAAAELGMEEGRWRSMDEAQTPSSSGVAVSDGDRFRGDGVVFVGFSAGVVAALGAAWAWQAQGRRVKALIAMDGWGVPLYGDFPIHRFSHDAFTHWSSRLLEGQGEDFYADPAVDHLELWRSPSTASGWWVNYVVPSVGQSGRCPLPVSAWRTRATATEVLAALLSRYGE